MRAGRARAAARVLVGGALGLCGLLLPAGIAVAAAAAARAAPALGTVVIPNPGPGYAVTSEGPLNPSQFASRSPDPAAAASAFATLAGPSRTYERVWEDDGGANQVQDLLVALPVGRRGAGLPAGGAARPPVRRDRERGPAGARPRGPADDLFRREHPGRGRTGHHHARRRRRGPAFVLLGGDGHRAADLPRRRPFGWPGPSTRPWWPPRAGPSPRPV